MPFSLAQPEPEPHPEFVNQYVCLVASGRGEAAEALSSPEGCTCPSLLANWARHPVRCPLSHSPGTPPSMGSIHNQKAKEEKYSKESNFLPLPTSPAPSALPLSPTSLPSTLFLAPLLRHSRPKDRPKDPDQMIKRRTLFLRPTGPST